MRGQTGPPVFVIERRIGGEGAWQSVKLTNRSSVVVTGYAPGELRDKGRADDHGLERGCDLRLGRDGESEYRRVIPEPPPRVA